MPFTVDAFSERTCRVVSRLAKEVVCEAHAIPHHAMIDGRAAIYWSRKRVRSPCISPMSSGSLTLNEVARHFSRTRATASHACANVEDRRDSPIFDLQFEYMEKQMRQRINDFRSGV